MKADIPFATGADLLPPAHLSPRAAALWRSVVPAKAKTMPRIALVQAALESLDRADQAREQIAEGALAFTTKTTGAVHVNPLTKLEKESRAAFVATWGGVLSFNWSTTESLQ